jgi:uncharacterized Tic20 family protein
MSDTYAITTPTEQERNWAMLTHLFAGVIAVLGTPFFAVGFTVIMWVVKKDESGFLDDHGREATNFWISLLIYSVAILPLAAIITCGVGALLYIPLFIIAVVGTIQATLAAKRGEYYRYPATIRML